jgi:hypothetical protein
MWHHPYHPGDPSSPIGRVLDVGPRQGLLDQPDFDGLLLGARCRPRNLPRRHPVGGENIRQLYRLISELGEGVFGE